MATPHGACEDQIGKCTEVHGTMSMVGTEINSAVGGIRELLLVLRKDRMAWEQGKEVEECCSTP